MKKKLLVLSTILLSFALHVSASDFVIDDFESKTIGNTQEMKAHYPEDGTATVVANPADATNKSLQIVTSNWDALPKFTVTLPAGKTLADYESISFDIYLKADVFKKMLVFIDNEKIYEDDGYPSQGTTGTWLTKVYAFEKLSAVTPDILAKTSFTISLGINTDEGDYYMDNIVLKASSPTFVIEDFESKTIGATQEMKAHYPEDGTATVVANPTDATNKCLQIVASNWDAMPKFTVTLPAGKTLADYESLLFDIYLKAEVYKKMNIYIDDDKIYEDDGYPSQGSTNTWLTKIYNFANLPLATSAILAKNSFTISVGISTDEGDYYMDNVVLKEKAGITGVNDMTASDVNIYVADDVLYFSGNASGVLIFDLKGSVIASAQNASSVNISQLIAGIYLIKAEIDGKTYVSKFVK